MHGGCVAFFIDRNLVLIAKTFLGSLYPCLYYVSYWLKKSCIHNESTYRGNKQTKGMISSMKNNRIFFFLILLIPMGIYCPLF